MNTKLSKRKFYRTVIEVEVLSEDPIDDIGNLTEIDQFITTGGGSGRIEYLKREVVNAKRAAKLLIAQGSDPMFFRLDDRGHEVDE